MTTIEYRIRGFLTRDTIRDGRRYRAGELFTVEIGDQEPFVAAGIFATYSGWDALISDWAQMAPAPDPGPAEAEPPGA